MVITKKWSEVKDTTEVGKDRERVAVWFVCSSSMKLHISHGRATELVRARPVHIRGQGGRA